MSDAAGRRPDLLESLLGLCEPDDVVDAPPAPAATTPEPPPAPEPEPAPVAPVAAQPEPTVTAAGNGRDVASVVTGLQHPDAARRREALSILARDEPDLRALARIALTDA